jgi:CheY-like chemotaxis protein
MPHRFDDVMRPVLLVEDSEDDRMLTLIALREAETGIPIEVVSDGVDAITRLEDAAKPLPILMLLELNMPRVSGTEVLKWRRHSERAHTVPVVVLTTSRKGADLDTCYANGANAYVRKPVDFDGFVVVMHHLVRFWLTINEPPPTLAAPST